MIEDDEHKPRGRPRKAEEENNLVWFTPEEIQSIASEAHRLTDDPMAFLEVAAKRFTEDREILHAVFRRLVEQVPSAKSLEGALKLIITALRVYDSKQEFDKPLMKRAQEMMGLRGESGRQKQQIAGRGGSGPRAIQAQSGGTPTAGAEDDSAAPGSTGDVEGGSVGVPDSEGSGDE